MRAKNTEPGVENSDLRLGPVNVIRISKRMAWNSSGRGGEIHVDLSFRWTFRGWEDVNVRVKH